ncbi:MAG: cytochrome C oxidase subunit IV family protein [Acidobacteria bacterium]|nr:cytochrome C oxidase subunit IV family protein [Acidobacteriota bacterium]
MRDDHAAAVHDPAVPHVHIVPARVLLAVWGALMLLTFVTVAVTWVNLGPLNLWVALGIATVKASLVALYFMHLRYDSPFNGLILVIALAFVALLVGGSLTDTREYQPDLIPGYAPALQEQPK